MSTNNNKLPRGYTIRVAHSSDIFKIICFYINEIYQTRKKLLLLLLFYHYHLFLYLFI